MRSSPSTEPRRASRSCSKQGQRPTRPSSYYVFDILELDGRGLTGLALRERKAILRDALSSADPVRFTAHRNRDGKRFFSEACEKGWQEWTRDGRLRHPRFLGGREDKPAAEVVCE